MMTPTTLAAAARAARAKVRSLIRSGAPRMDVEIARRSAIRAEAAAEAAAVEVRS